MRAQDRDCHATGPIRARRCQVGVAAAVLLLAQGANALLPAQFDWRNVGGKDFTTPVSNQGNCGSDWAVATADAVQAVWKIEADDAAASPHFSAQELVSCDTAFNMGCGGGNPGNALQYVRDIGLVSEACFNYSSALGTAEACPGSWATCPDAPAQVPTRVKVTGYTFSYLPTSAAMMQAIYDRGPVLVMMDVYQDLYTYSAGIYAWNHAAVLNGGHVVSLVGWGSEAGTDYWIVQNTWGTSWGELGPGGTRGYFRIRRGIDEVGIEKWLYVVGGIAGCLCPDGDGDGYFTASCRDPECLGERDCQPNDPASHPGAVEVCDGVDNDCDGVVDAPGPGLCPAGEECIAGACVGAEKEDPAGLLPGCSCQQGAGPGAWALIVPALWRGRRVRPGTGGAR